MQQDKALSILKALADGVDPVTGEQFPAGGPYQHPDIVRALFWAVQTLGAPVRSQRPATPRPEGVSNSGKPWSEEEDTQLAQAFDAGKPIEQLAEMHKRSRWAIEARLVKLGKLEAPKSGFTPRYPTRKGTDTTVAGAQG